MRLQPREAIRNLHARIFQAARPVNVRHFIEARLEFDDDSDFFFSSGIEQRFRDRRIRIRAIQRLLHRQNARIAAGRIEKIHDGVVRLVRMMDENILVTQSFKHRIGVVADTNLFRRERRIFQIGPRRFFVQMKQPLDIDGAAHAKHQRFVELKFGDEARDDFRMRAFFDFQADRAAFSSLCDLRVDRFEQRAAFFLFEIKVAVARHAESGGRDDLVAAI